MPKHLPMYRSLSKVKTLLLHFRSRNGSLWSSQSSLSMTLCFCVFHVIVSVSTPMLSWRIFFVAVLLMVLLITYFSLIVKLTLLLCLLKYVVRSLSCPGRVNYISSKSLKKEIIVTLLMTLPCILGAMI